MSYTRRTRCGSCQSDELHTVLDLGNSPPANGEDDTKYPLQLGVCLKCSLLQQMTVLSDKLLFDGTYHFYSSASEPKVVYHNNLAELLWYRHLCAKENPLVLEVACNDGDLLRHFKSRGTRTLGIDPARGPALVAQERGIEVLNWPFSLSHAQSISSDYGDVDLLIANHVIAHVVDIHNFAAGIAHLLGPKGVAVIEFQYAQDMIVGNQFDHVYHEHRYHYTVTTISELMGRHGLYLLNAEWVEPQGGSIRATFGKTPLPKNSDQDERLARVLLSERWLKHPYALQHELQGRANWTRNRLLQIIKQMHDDYLTVAGYGATAKSVSMINFCELDRSHIQFVVDTTPHKQGRRIPGTDVPIVAPSDVVDPPDTYVMWAWNYASHIIRKELAFMEHGGKWLIPTPYPTVI